MERGRVHPRDLDATRKALAILRRRLSPPRLWALLRSIRLVANTRARTSRTYWRCATQRCHDPSTCPTGSIATSLRGLAAGVSCAHEPQRVAGDPTRHPSRAQIAYGRSGFTQRCRKDTSHLSEAAIDLASGCDSGLPRERAQRASRGEAAARRSEATSTAGRGHQASGRGTNRDDENHRRCSFPFPRRLGPRTFVLRG